MSSFDGDGIVPLGGEINFRGCWLFGSGRRLGYGGLAGILIAVIGVVVIGDDGEFRLFCLLRRSRGPRR